MPTAPPESSPASRPSPGQEPARPSARLPTPDRLRGLAHPVRMRILAALRAHGPTTATALAHRLNLNSGATSYHLRQLATYGFIVEAAELGNRRDRFWQIDPTQDGAPTPSLEGRAADLQAALLEHANAAQAAVESHPELEPEWQQVTTFTTRELNLTAAQAKALLERIESVIAEAATEAGAGAGSGDSDDSVASAEPSKTAGSPSRTPGSRPFVVQVQGYAPAQP